MAGFMTTDPGADNQASQTDVTEKNDSGVLTGQVDGPADTQETPAATPPQAPARPTWMEQLPADQKDDGSLTRFKTIGDLGRAYRELEGKLGKSITPPDANASPEEKAAFYAKLGCPEKPEEYDLGGIRMPDGIEPDKAFEDGFKGEVHRLGLSKAQAQDLYGWYTRFAGDRVQSLTADRVEAATRITQELQTEWGPKYREEVGYMVRAMQKFGTPELRTALDESGMSNNKDLIKLFTRIGKAVSEDSFVDSREEKESKSKKSPAHIMFPGMN